MDVQLIHCPPSRLPRGNARLIYTVFALDALVELVKRVIRSVGMPVATSIGAQKPLCIRAQRAHELALGPVILVHGCVSAIKNAGKNPGVSKVSVALNRGHHLVATKAMAMAKRTITASVLNSSA